jgi:hypothetical protein
MAAGNSNNKPCTCQFCQSQKILQRQQQQQQNSKPPCKNTMKIRETLNRMYEEAARDAALKRQKEIEYQKTLRRLNLTNRYKEKERS